MGEPSTQVSIPQQAILEKLECILQNEEFHTIDKMLDFLQFAIEETLAGNAR